MEKQILILLAAYKGGRFIRPMVDSILAQDVGGWRLILSDDGEDTAPILQEYADKYPDKITHYRSGRRFGSAQKHFMHLLEQFGGQADCIMFSDQDDVWHPDKVRLTLRLMEQAETDPALPVLVHTDLRVVDGQLHEMDPSFQHYSGLDGHRLALEQLLVQNVVTGCTMMINRSLARLACRPVGEGDMLMHDWWLALIAAAMGRAVFLDRATIDYRQHGGVLTAAHGQDGFLHQFLQGPAQAVGPLLDHVPGAPGGELLVLVLLFQALDLHVLAAPAGTHQSRGPDEAGQLVGGEQDLLHQMGGLHIAADAIAMAAHGVDQVVTAARFPQKLRRLLAVLFRPLLKVDVVQQAHRGPEVRLLAIAQLLGIPAHDSLHRQGMLKVERLLIILPQRRQRRLPGDAFSHARTYSFVSG